MSWLPLDRHHAPILAALLKKEAQERGANSQQDPVDVQVKVEYKQANVKSVQPWYITESMLSTIIPETSQVVRVLSRHLDRYNINRDTTTLRAQSSAHRPSPILSRLTSWSCLSLDQDLPVTVNTSAEKSSSPSVCADIGGPRHAEPQQESPPPSAPKLTPCLNTPELQVLYRHISRIAGACTYTGYKFLVRDNSNNTKIISYCCLRQRLVRAQHDYEEDDSKLPPMAAPREINGDCHICEIQAGSCRNNTSIIPGVVWSVRTKRFYIDMDLETFGDSTHTQFTPIVIWGMIEELEARVKRTAPKPATCGMAPMLSVKEVPYSSSHLEVLTSGEKAQVLSLMDFQGLAPLSQSVQVPEPLVSTTMVMNECGVFHTLTKGPSTKSRPGQKK